VVFLVKLTGTILYFQGTIQMEKRARGLSCLILTLLMMEVLISSCAVPARDIQSGQENPLPVAATITASPPAPVLSTDSGEDPPPTAVTGITLDQLKNMEYHLDAVEELLPGNQGRFQLTNGRFEQQYPGAASGITVALIQSATGDLNGDHQEDAVVVLAINSGGSGTFIYLVPVINQSGQFQAAAGTLLGDRVAVHSMGIQDGVIRLNLLTHAPEDPLCCPSLERTIQYRLVGDRLLSL
jgi:hypothetical protein